MRIDIMNLQNKVRISKKGVEKYVKSILKAMGESDAELSLLFVTDLYIKRLNWKYRRVNSKTDVLAFSMREGDDIPKDSPILGDVVVSTETAKREAIKRSRPVQKEIYLYLVHGILHLLGYDDKKPNDRRKMKLKEEKLLEVL
ncbi:rRNA maturation RNase YbeY [Candidatus Omnitrophota bacterium]